MRLSHYTSRIRAENILKNGFSTKLNLDKSILGTFVHEDLQSQKLSKIMFDNQYYKNSVKLLIDVDDNAKVFDLLSYVKKHKLDIIKNGDELIIINHEIIKNITKSNEELK